MSFFFNTQFVFFNSNPMFFPQFSFLINIMKCRFIYFINLSCIIQIFAKLPLD